MKNAPGVAELLNKFKGRKCPMLYYSVMDDFPNSIAEIATEATLSLVKNGIFKVLIENRWDRIKDNVNDIVNQIVSSTTEEKDDLELFYVVTEAVKVVSYKNDRNQEISATTLYLALFNKDETAPE